MPELVSVSESDCYETDTESDIAETNTFSNQQHSCRDHTFSTCHMMRRSIAEDTKGIPPIPGHTRPDEESDTEEDTPVQEFRDTLRNHQVERWVKEGQETDVPEGTRCWTCAWENIVQGQESSTETDNDRRAETRVKMKTMVDEILDQTKVPSNLAPINDAEPTGRDISPTSVKRARHSPDKITQENPPKGRPRHKSPNVHAETELEASNERDTVGSFSKCQQREINVFTSQKKNSEENPPTNKAEAFLDGFRSRENMTWEHYGEQKGHENNLETHQQSQPNAVPEAILTKIQIQPSIFTRSDCGLSPSLSGPGRPKMQTPPLPLETPDKPSRENTTWEDCEERNGQRVCSGKSTNEFTNNATPRSTRTVIRRHNPEASRSKAIREEEEHDGLKDRLGKRTGESKDVARAEAKLTGIRRHKTRNWEGQKVQGRNEKEKPAGGENEEYKDEVVVVVQDQPTTAQPHQDQPTTAQPQRLIISFTNLPAHIPFVLDFALSMPKARAPAAVRCSSFQPSPDFRPVKATVCNLTDDGAQDDIREYEYVFPTAPRPNNASQPAPIPVPASFANDVSAKFRDILADILPRVHDEDEKFHVAVAVSATSVRLQPQFEKEHGVHLEHNQTATIDRTFMVNGRVLTFEVGKDPSVRMGHVLLTQLSGVIEPSLMPPSERDSNGDPLWDLADMNPKRIGLTPDGRSPRLHHSGPLIALDVPTHGERTDIDSAGGWIVTPHDVDPIPRMICLAESSYETFDTMQRRRELAAYNDRIQNKCLTHPRMHINRHVLQDLLDKTTYTPEARRLVTRTLEGIVDIVGNTRVIFLNQLRLLPDDSANSFNPSIDEPTRTTHVLSYLSILHFLTNPELVVFEEEGEFYPAFPLNAPAIVPPVVIPSFHTAIPDSSPRPPSPASSTSYHPTSPPMWVNDSPAWDALSVNSEVMAFDYKTWSTQAHIGTTPDNEPSLSIPAEDDHASVGTSPPLPHRRILSTVNPTDTVSATATPSGRDEAQHFSQTLVDEPHNDIIEGSALFTFEPVLPPINLNSTAPPDDSDTSIIPPTATSREVNYAEATSLPLSNPIMDIVARILDEDGYFMSSSKKDPFYAGEDDLSDMETDSSSEEETDEEEKAGYASTGVVSHPREDPTAQETSSSSSSSLGSSFSDKKSEDTEMTDGEEDGHEELVAVRAPPSSPSIPAPIPTHITTPADDVLEFETTSPPLIRTVALPPTAVDLQTLEALKPRLKGIHFALRTRNPDNTGYRDTTLVDKCRHVDSIFVEPDVIGRGAMGHPFSGVGSIPVYNRLARIRMQLFKEGPDQHPLREHGIHYRETTDPRYACDHEEDGAAWVKDAWAIELSRLRARQDHPLDESSLDLASARPSILAVAERIINYKPIFRGLMQLSDFRSYHEPRIDSVLAREDLLPVWFEGHLTQEYPTRQHMLTVRESGVQSMCTNEMTAPVVSFLNPHFDGRTEIRHNAWLQPADLDYLRDTRFRISTIIDQFIRYMMCASTRALVDSLSPRNPLSHFFYFHCKSIRYLQDEVQDECQGFNAHCTHADPAYVGPPPYPPCPPLIPINSCLTADEDEFLYHVTWLFRVERYGHLADRITDIRGMRFFLPQEVRTLFVNGYLDPLSHFDHLGHKFPYMG
ncbi:hypothetical protein BDZ89DRAFT_1136676 [Hymenopellis radicata]|nr:hypothetical protein BDZ89DRAFT_1136676 [Hymenopellis radicata]